MRQLLIPRTIRQKLQFFLGIFLNKIVIYITHKISTIQTADKLYFLENGELTGIGTHEELKQSNLSYQQYLSKEKDNHL